VYTLPCKSTLETSVEHNVAAVIVMTIACRGKAMSETNQIGKDSGTSAYHDRKSTNDDPETIKQRTWLPPYEGMEHSGLHCEQLTFQVAT
jgi:hypothetical protein